MNGLSAIRRHERNTISSSTDCALEIHDEPALKEHFMFLMGRESVNSDQGEH